VKCCGYTVSCHNPLLCQTLLRACFHSSLRHTAMTYMHRSMWNQTWPPASDVSSLSRSREVLDKGKGLDTWYAAYMRRLEQQCFTILEVAADWHELMVLWHSMQPSSARDSRQVDPWHSKTDIPPPQSAALGLHPVARRLLLINRPRRDGTLSWCWYTAATDRSRTHDLPIRSQVRHRTTRPPRKEL